MGAEILSTIQLWGPIIVTASCIITAAFPRPKNKFMSKVWDILNAIALNIGNAKNKEEK